MLKIDRFYQLLQAKAKILTIWQEQYVLLN